MRVLAEGGERRPLLAAIAFAAGGIALTVGVVWGLLGAVTATAAAASPTATAAVGGDPRSSGSGPGLVGEPILAVVAVIVLQLIRDDMTFMRVDPNYGLVAQGFILIGVLMAGSFIQMRRSRA
jgi:ribose/xylose/arabinose/galactoside ABC-type transport system permease subunit